MSTRRTRSANKNPAIASTMPAGNVQTQDAATQASKAAPKNRKRANSAAAVPPSAPADQAARPSKKAKGPQAVSNMSPTSTESVDQTVVAGTAGKSDAQARSKSTKKAKNIVSYNSGSEGEPLSATRARFSARSTAVHDNNGKKNAQATARSTRGKDAEEDIPSDGSNEMENEDAEMSSSGEEDDDDSPESIAAGLAAEVRVRLLVYGWSLTTEVFARSAASFLDQW
ncbi:hypothetical protein BV20DRAFT_677918 [Pilatotrama ljubarskyi]|nr:hypothetical protein BV20DRAFT_677918 [Pilatotrama ljubarskyi]